MTKEEYEQQINEAFDRNDYKTAHALGEQMEKEGMPLGAYFMAAASNGKDDYFTAEKEIDRYLAQEPGNSDGWVVKGQIMMGMDNYYAAYPCYDKAVELGDNNALGYSAVCRYLYAQDHLNDNPDSVEQNSELFTLLEEAIILSSECIAKNPDDYDFYSVLPMMLYTDYSFINAGRSANVTVTHTKKDIFGNILEQDSYKTAGGMSFAGVNSIWEMRDVIKNEENRIERSTEFAFNRAMKFANGIQAAGKTAEADLIRFEMIQAEIDCKGKRIAPDAVWFYKHAHAQASEKLGDRYDEWSDDFAKYTTEYVELVKKFGSQIKKAQNSGQQPNFLRYYLEEERIPADVMADIAKAQAGEQVTRNRASDAELDIIGGGSDKITAAGILAAAGNADIAATFPTAMAGLIYAIFSNFGTIVAIITLVLCVGFFLYGLGKSSDKIPADGERKAHRIAQLCFFILFIINFFLGLAAVIVTKLFFKTKQ